MITIEKLTISYQKGYNVIESLDLVLSEETINGVVGLNGAGKTTLLNAIYGLKSVDAGEVKFNGRKLNKKDISFLETENFFYSNITGREYLGLFIRPGFEDDKWNELFMLPLDSIIDNYSSGMKKKLAIMGIIKQDKPIMILDEPFNGLDIETCRIIRQLLLKMKEHGKTIIITSHIIETLTNLCDFIHYLENGKIRETRNKNGFSEFEKEIFESIELRNEEVIKRLMSVYSTNAG